MDSTIVIKVKYGKTLRRFNVRVNGAGRLELTADTLREKILSLFQLPQEVELTLTYLDEDGDSVTLADDEDIHDIMGQSLNPLRITAKVKSENVNASSMRPSGDSSILESAQRAPKPFANLNNTVSKVSKAVSNSMNYAIRHEKMPENVIHSIPAPNWMLNSIVDPNSINHPIRHEKNPEPAIHSIPAPDWMLNSIADSNSINHPIRHEKKPEPVIHSTPVPDWIPNSIADPNSINHPIRYEKRPELVFHSTPASDCMLNSIADPNSINHPIRYEKKPEPVIRSTPAPDWMLNYIPDHSSDGKKDLKKKNSFPNTANFGGNTSTRLAAAVPYTHFGPQMHPFKGGFAGIFHGGVRCDGCGVNPIAGPRFKSKVKDNYDLCSTCFAKMGSEVDYIRLDRPIPYAHHRLCKPLVSNFKAQMNPSFLQTPRDDVKPNLPKLDCRFIRDVNVVPGTVMAPSTRFTKIWLMRNTGTLVWPQGTQLVWFSGDRLSASLSVVLQIPVEGVAIEKELEVAVDVVAPELPGRYLSYWRMASPAGQQFGQRIWVLIQVVDASRKDSELNNSWKALNLNLPTKKSEAFNIKPIGPRFPIPALPNGVTNLVDPLDFPIDDYLPINGEVGPSRVSYPTVISPPPPLPCVLTSVAAPPPGSLVAESSAQASDEEEDEMEEMLLRRLEGMGFDQVDLNKEILRMNAYNLEKSVDDLSNVFGWDRILKELQVMGFRDNELNKELLMKNNGSIKGVVMDLIAGEKV